MKRILRAWLLAVPVATAMLFSTACTPPNDVGSEVLPDDDLVSGTFVDTFGISMRTLIVDSLNSYKASRVLLGNYVDKEMGHIFAEAYMQTRIQGADLSFSSKPENLSLDSIVLSLDITGFYGQYDDPLELEIFEITETFSEDSFPSTETYLGVDDSYDLANNAKIDFRGLTGFLDFISIRLDDSLGRKLLFAPTDSISDNDVFQEFFKGLLVRTKPVDQSLSRESGGIFYIQPTTDRTLLTMYYKDSTSSEDYTFDITSSSDYHYATKRTDVAGRLLDIITDPSQDMQTVPYAAIQAGAITKTFVKIPSIESLKGRSINRAELILPVDSTFFGGNERFTPPTSLIVYPANEDGTAEENLNTIITTGTYDATRNRYVLTLTNATQSIISGRLENTGFIIVPGDRSVTMNRAILAGPGHPFLTPKFRVVFTSLPTGG